MRKIDLSRGCKHEHPDIEVGKTYLARIYGSWYLGRFNRQWYGLNFRGWEGTSLQFDAPGYNRSGWEALIEVDTASLDEWVGMPQGLPENFKHNRKRRLLKLKRRVP